MNDILNNEWKSKTEKYYINIKCEKIVFTCIYQYFPLWEYWTGRYFPGNTTREIPPWYFPDNPDMYHSQTK